MRDLELGGWDSLRYEPMLVRLRAFDGDRAVVDTERARLVWEPHRVVPSYAVPAADVAVELTPTTAEPPEPMEGVELLPGVRILPPGRFRYHSADGVELDLRLDAGVAEGGAYRPSDPDLADYVVLDFHAFDRWLEEDEPAVSHPRDPFKRIDVKRSDRHVRVERDGTVLADSRRPSLLLETFLPIRYYLPAEDVRTDLLQPSATDTWCAYKGQATHHAVPGPDGPVDVAWSYADPLNDAVPVQHMICFYDERVDVIVDDVAGERPRTPWS